MEIVVNTIYTYERLVKFNNFYAKRRKGLWIIMGIFSGLYLLMFLAEYVMFRYVNMDYLMYLLLFLLLTIFYLVMLVVVPRARLKKSKVLGGLTTFTFKDTHFESKHQSALISEVRNNSYELIYRIMEDNENIYLFVSRNQACILDKNGIENGTVESLKAFLRTKVEPKKIKLK